MKNIFFICMFGLLAFAGCSDNEEEILTGGNIDIDMLPPNQPNDVIDEKLFAVINLDYPGLEKAKEFYNSGKYYYAVNELLEYYRNRTSVINPNIQLMNTPITARSCWPNGNWSPTKRPVRPKAATATTFWATSRR